MMERRQLQATEPFGLKNMPMRPRERARLLETPGAVHVESDDGEVILVPDLGQLRLYWGFDDQETMRQVFPEMFEALREHITPDGADYVATDLVGLPTREWLMPMFRDAMFEFFAEWMDMTNPGLDPDVIPEFPEGVTIRRAQEDDFERCREIWLAAQGEVAEGPRSFDAMIDESTWIGAMEDGGTLVGFVINGEVDRAEGRVLTMAVAPEADGHNYGVLLLQAATYQLTTQEARRATIRVRPDIPNALKTCADAGFKFSRGGLEYRRPTDESLIEEVLEERRRVGVKARFGKWR